MDSVDEIECLTAIPELVQSMLIENTNQDQQIYFQVSTYAGLHISLNALFVLFPRL